MSHNTRGSLLPPPPPARPTSSLGLQGHPARPFLSVHSPPRPPPRAPSATWSTSCLSASECKWIMRLQGLKDGRGSISHPPGKAMQTVKLDLMNGLA